jgi:hypothetical protein
MSGARALFKVFTDAGLDTCFANPGTEEGMSKQDKDVKARRQV